MLRGRNSEDRGEKRLPDRIVSRLAGLASVCVFRQIALLMSSGFAGSGHQLRGLQHCGHRRRGHGDNWRRGRQVRHRRHWPEYLGDLSQLPGELRGVRPWAPTRCRAMLAPGVQVPRDEHAFHPVLAGSGMMGRKAVDFFLGGGRLVFQEPG